MKKGDWIYFTENIKLTRSLTRRWGITGELIEKNTPFKIKAINKSTIEIYLHKKLIHDINPKRIIDSWKVRNRPQRMKLHTNPNLCEALYGLSKTDGPV